MRNLLFVLLLVTIGLLACKAPKKYELVLHIKNTAPTIDQIDSTVTVLKKRLQSFDKGKTMFAVSPNQQSITLQTACGDQDFISNVLVKRGSLLFYECYSIADPEIVTALQNADKAMHESIKANVPIVAGVSNTAFNTEAPLFHLFVPRQGYQDKLSGMMQYPAEVGNVLDSLLPLLKKCLPLLYKHLPIGSMFIFKPMDDKKYKAQEIYLVKNDATIYNASRHIANAVGDMDYANHPVVSMTFNKVGTQLWKRMTTKNVGKYIAIVLDGELMSVPIVHSPIEGGNSQISGVFTFEQTQDMAAALGNGYLPLTLQIGSIKLSEGK
jgi:SecD/SecF fusion protein